VIDAARAQVISASGHELRVWHLKPRDSSLVKSMPCAGFHIEPSPDGALVAVDCTEGSVWTWSRDTGVITQIHKHAGFAFGTQWVNGMICSGGRGDGRVLCSTPDGTYTRVLDSGTTRITWLTATPDHRSLIFASSDGKIWRFDSTLRELYAHAGSPIRMAISPDGRMLASCAVDGSLAVYDLVNRRVVSHLIGHDGAASCITWVGDELWTSGNDGALKRWGLRDGSLTLRHSVQMSGAFRWISVANGGWAANVGDGVLLVSLDGVSLALRLDIGGAIDTLDVSPDLRYVAAGAGGELVVVDMQSNAIATTAIDSIMAQQVSFVDTISLTFGVPAALYALQVDRLDYVTFEADPEPRNRASF
jgi:WD40 repeat protein